MPLPAFLPVPPPPAALLAAAPPAPTAVPALAPTPALPADAFPTYAPPKDSPSEESGMGGSVETFDPVARAVLMATRLPRYWRGSYRSFDRDAPLRPVQLWLDSVVPTGQMVVLRGRLRIEEVETAFQGNINAKSDQLDLLPLASVLGGGLEPGGEFQGLQGLSLSGWHAPRLTTPGGRLELAPAPAAAAAAMPPTTSPAGAPAGGQIRGLW